jgi:predicted transposase YbfD/YdcC
MKKKRMREEKANERREMGCEKNMEMKEEEADVRRRWKKRKRSGCEHKTFLSKEIN